MKNSTPDKKVNSSLRLFSLILFLCVAYSFTYGQQTGASASLKNFMDNRFGLFIHWGPVSLRGTEIGWSRDREVPKDDYDSLYKEFNPVLYDADAWVSLAKEAGMKYLTITTRHHDGFCIWPTKYTDYNISNTPYKKDILKPLSEACKKYGIKLCFYYSILDWHHPDYPIHSAYDTTLDPHANLGRYILFMKDQLRELITNYNPYMLWFDGQWEKPWTDEMGKELYNYVKGLKPDIITNNRLGKEMAATNNKKIDVLKMIGDYDTPEQVVGRLNMELPWESCFTLGQQWAWKPNDKISSLSNCLSILSKTAGSNGNLLLNVGPMPDGRIEMRQAKRLKEIGRWLEENGAAIYSTKGGPFPPTGSFATTRKGNKIYIHVLGPDLSTLSLPLIPERKINRAYTMSGERLSVTTGEESFTIKLSSEKHQLQYIVILELDGDAETIPIIQ